MKNTTMLEAVGLVSDGLITESLSFFERPIAYKREKSASAFARFMTSGWGVAMICAFVGLGVMCGIIWAGNNPPDIAPFGAAESETESYITVDPEKEEDTADNTVPEIEKESETETETEAEPQPSLPYSEGLEFTSNGNGTCTLSGLGSCQDKDVVIPPVSPDGETVIEIGRKAFIETDIQSVVIPEGVRIVGYYAFYDCDRLTAVTLPEGLEHMKSFCFWGCDALTEIVMPDSVTELGEMAFAYCQKLRSVTLSPGINRIEYQTFVECPKLSKVNLSEGLVEIRELAFAGCTGLVFIEIPQSVVRFGDAAFMNCSALQEIRLPKKMQSWGESVFTMCTSLRSIEVPSGLTEINISTFEDCTALEEVIIPEGMQTIREYAFSLCSSLPSLRLPKSLQKIEIDVFYRCDSLTEIIYAGSAEAWEAVEIEMREWAFDALQYATVTFEEVFYPTVTEAGLTFVSLGNGTCSVAAEDTTLSGAWKP